MSRCSEASSPLFLINEKKERKEKVVMVWSQRCGKFVTFLKRNCGDENYLETNLKYLKLYVLGISSHQFHTYSEIETTVVPFTSSRFNKSRFCLAWYRGKNRHGISIIIKLLTSNTKKYWMDNL